MKLVKLPPEAQQAVEDAGEEEDECQEVAEELEVAVKHFEVRSTKWEGRVMSYELRVTKYEVGGGRYEVRRTNYEVRISRCREKEPDEGRGLMPFSGDGGGRRGRCSGDDVRARHAGTEGLRLSLL